MPDLSLSPVTDVSRFSPPLYRNAIRRRESLWHKLKQGLGHRLVVVQAGAGYGKTAFLADFARDQAGLRGIPTAWLTLDRIHLDRVRLLGDLVLAVHAVHPGRGVVTLDALSKSKEVLRRWDYFLELFRRELQEAEGPPALVILDQYETVAISPNARAVLDHVVSALPPSLALLVSSRRPLGLPSIPRLRGRGQVWILAAADLCFTGDEVRELFSQCLAVSLSDGALGEVMDKTSGWPAGIQMVGAFVTRHGEKALLDFSGSRTDFYRYLCEGVFHGVPVGARPYLMSTALVDEISPGLDRLLAGDDRDLEGMTLLEKGDYPGATVDIGEGVFHRHNPVFRTFLLQKLKRSFPAGRVRDLHLKLAQFHSGSGQWDASLYHLLEAREYERASEMVASLAEEAISDNYSETLANWIDAFPEEERNRRPWLLLYGGVTHRIARKWEKALELYDRAADIFRAQGKQDGLARTLWYASQVLAYRRNQRLATILAAEALTYLDPSDLPPRAWILHSMGNSYFDLGQTDEGLRCHQEALDLFTALGSTPGQMMQNQALAWALHRLGRLREAQQHYVRALGLQAQIGDVNVLCWLQAGLAHLRAMRGDYSDSIAGLNEVVGIARKHHLRPAEAFALLNLADIYLDLGNLAEADACCRQALTACYAFDDDAPQIDLRLKLMEVDRLKGQLGLPFHGEPSLGLADWVVASNLETTKIAHDLQKAASFLAEGLYDEAVQRASEAKNLATRIGAKYHEAQACYLLGRVHLLRGELQASTRLVEELLPLVEDEEYAGFLLREPQATGDLLMNALRRSPAREQAAALLLRLAGLREGVAAPLLGSDTSPSTDEVAALRDRLLSQGPALAMSGSPKMVRPQPMKSPAGSEGLRGSDAESRAEAFEIHTLGPLIVGHRGRVVTDRAWRTHKAKELFAYLLTRGNASATRDELLDVLWPELSVDSAVSNFHFTVHSLRRALESHLPPRPPSGYLVFSGRHYRLEMPSQTWIDAQEFKTCVSEGLKLASAAQADVALPLLERAVELYQGDYLADLFADWVEPIREALLEAYLNTLRQLALLAYGRRDYDKVLSHARAMLKKDNYLEDAHRLLMRAACEMGNSALAIRQYEGLAQLLRDELDVEPDATTQELNRQIREGTYRRN